MLAPALIALALAAVPSPERSSRRAGDAEPSAALPSPSVAAEAAAPGRGAASEALPLPYAPDETMEFEVEYLGIEAGKAQISVGHQSGPILPVFLRARTGGLGSLFDFRQQLATYLDVGTGLPRSCSMESVEPRYRRLDTTRFDRRAGKATVRTQGRNDRTEEIDVPPDTTDFVGMVFRLRTLPLDPGTRHEFHVIAGNRHSTVVAQAETRETLDTGAGRLASIRVRVPTSFSGKFSEKNPTFVWFSDDARRIIVRIRTEFAIGGAVAKLVSYRPGKR